MSRQEADAVDPQMILSFLRSPWGKKAMSSRAVREYEFAALFSPAELRLGDDTEQEILMNGVIDLLIFEDDGLTIVDFKTDSILPGSEEKAAERHRLQLEIYASAAEKIFCLPVREKIVFFLKTGAGAAL
jgi:ATP-dependent helicase/nuclease subunit A